MRLLLVVCLLAIHLHVILQMGRSFVVARDFFLEYWRRSDTLVDYLLVDYLIVLAQKYCNSVAMGFEIFLPTILNAMS